MDWQKCMNQAMDYIEENLLGQIDYNEAAKYMNCSEGEFRRIFSFLAKIPLSEYVRNRRLTSSVQDIQSGEKIIEIADRYGYESQAAFSRAFRRFHGIPPSLAREQEVTLNRCPRLTFKLVLMEGSTVMEDSTQRANVIGARDVGCAVSVDKNINTIHQTNETFWSIKGNDVLGTTALPLYGAFVSEENCQLFGEMNGKKVLEIGCGTGHSLHYVGKRGASELWGLDISKDQIDKTKAYLAKHDLVSNLICSPMEEACGIPTDYFDIVYSVYGIGWTTDLDCTFERVYSYLKQGGTFIFSWSHPIHKCVSFEDEGLHFKKILL